MACNYGRIEIAKILVSYKADIHAIDQFGFKYYLFHKVRFCMQQKRIKYLWLFI